MVDVFSCDCGAFKRGVNKLNDVMKELLCPTCGTKMQGRVLVVQESLVAYVNLDESKMGRRRKQVLDAVKLLVSANNREIAVFLGLPINCVTGRVKELREMGRLKNVGFKKDLLTCQNTKIWGLS